MQIYHTKEFIVIPMALNAFYFNIPFGAKRITYSNTVSVSEEFLNALFNFVESFLEQQYIFLDMKNTDYAFRLFEKFGELKRIVIFMNIDSNVLRDKLKDNLPTLCWSTDEKSAALNTTYDSTIGKWCAECSNKANHEVCVQIIKNLIDEVPQNPIIPQKLESSGLYSNMYVNIKKLFLYPEKYYALLYNLAQKIVEVKWEFDGFISASKNGAILANLLGMLLNKKSIHIMGIGPKYSMNIGSIQKEIKKRKNYVYVYDFRCTGTEMKIISSLVNSHEAYIRGAIGIAVYNGKEMNDKDIVYLVDIKKEGIPYKIAGEIEDIIRLVKQ